MKSLFLILFFWSAFLLIGSTQEIKHISFIATHQPFNVLFDRHKELKEIRFKFIGNNAFPEIEIRTKAPSVFEALNNFDLYNAGDRYFFENQYGSFHLPDSLYILRVDKKADAVIIEGSIRHDSIFFTITETHYPPRKESEEEEKIFIKIESRVDYKNGLHILAQELANSLCGLEIPSTDSVVVLKAIIEKSGTLKILSIEVGSTENLYTKTLIDLLNASAPWIPYNAGGRPARTYKKIYVGVKADKTYRIAMQ